MLKVITLHYITCHLADAFDQSDLQYVHQPRVQTKNYNNTESHTSSRKSKYKSTISKRHLSATEELICVSIQKRRVFQFPAEGVKSDGVHRTTATWTVMFYNTCSFILTRMLMWIMIMVDK